MRGNLELQTLKVSPRIKYLIRTGEDPDDPKRYDSRSEALFAVLQALVAAGYDDASIAAVVIDPVNGISDKPLSQKNQRNPRYMEQTRTWVAKEIARARDKHQGAQEARQDAEKRQNGDDTAIDRPQINFNTEVQLVTNQGQNAILNMPDGPHLYQRARRLCFIARGVKPPKWMSRPADAPVIVEASSAYIERVA